MRVRAPMWSETYPRLAYNVRDLWVELRRRENVPRRDDLRPKKQLVHPPSSVRFYPLTAGIVDIVPMPPAPAPDVRVAAGVPVLDGA